MLFETVFSLLFLKRLKFQRLHSSQTICQNVDGLPLPTTAHVLALTDEVEVVFTYNTSGTPG